MVAKSCRPPSYNLRDLVRDCATRGKVHVKKQAREDAKGFGFESQTRIIDFISLGDFDRIQHDNTDVLGLGPDKGTPFDAYIFVIGPRYVYLAFYQRPNGDWIIKSFHSPQYGDKALPLTHSPFKILEGIKNE